MNDVVTSTFRAWITEQMRIHQLSPQRLAAASGVHRTTLSRLLDGTRSPSLDTAARLAFVFGVPEPSAALDVLTVGLTAADPAVRVEAALRCDPRMTDQAVVETLHFYRERRSR